MGKVFLRVKTNNNDGIPTDQVAFVDAPNRGTPDPYGTDDHTPTDTDSKNPRVKVLTASSYAHYGGTGFTADAIIILNDDSTQGKIHSVRVLTRGSDYGTADGPSTAPPQVTFGSETFTAVLGTGEPMRESILIAEGGAKKNSDGLFLNKERSGARQIPKAVGETEFTTIPVFADLFKNEVQASEFPIFNPYQKHIDYGDLAGFGKNVITTAGAFASLSAISELRSQVSETNRRVDVASQQAESFNVQLLAGHEAECIAAEEAARQNFEDDLVDFGEGTGLDVLQFSNNLAGSTAVDPVWNSIANTISNLLPFYKAWAIATNQPVIPGIDSNFSPNRDAIAFYNNLDSTKSSEAFFPSMGSPTYPNPPKLADTSKSYASLPKSVGVFQTISQGLLIKALCFAGFAALGHLYQLLSSSNASASFSSTLKVLHSPNVFAPKDTDGVFVEWFKTNCRQHDILGNAHAMMSGVYGVFKAIVGALSDGETGSDDNKRIKALMAAAAASSMVESLKSTHSLLTKWVDTCNRKDSGKFSNDERVYIQRLDIARGCIAVKLDEIAWYYNNGFTIDDRGKDKFQILMSAVGEDGVLGHANAKSAEARGTFSHETSLHSRSFSPCADTERCYSVILSSELSVDARGEKRPTTRDGYEIVYNAVKIYGNSSTFSVTNPIAHGPAEVEVRFKDGRMTNIDIRNRGAGFLFAPVVRIDPRVWMEKTKKAAMIVVDTEWTDKGYVEKADLDVTIKGLMAAAKDGALNKEISTKNAQEMLDKHKGILENLNNYIVNILPRLLTRSLLKAGEKENLEHSYEDGDFKKELKVVRKGFGFNLSRYKPMMNSSVFATDKKATISDLRSSIITKIYGSNAKNEQELENRELCVLDFFTFELGKCDYGAISSMNDDLAKVFFKSPEAYRLATLGQTVNETICQKAACGVAHVYSEAPSIQLENDPSPICGNSTVTYNLHPTAEWWFNWDGGRASLAQKIISENNINSKLRIHGTDKFAPWSDAFAVGELGDTSVPPVFGNWTIALGNDGDNRGLVRKAFDFLIGIPVEVVSFSQARKIQLLNPVINVPFGGVNGEKTFATKLLIEYDDRRLHRFEWLKKAAGGAEVSAGSTFLPGGRATLAPWKARTGKPFVESDKYWSRNSSEKYIAEHERNLAHAYQLVANAGGKKAWDDDIVDSMKVDPILSRSQTFSGMCYPHITQYDVGKEAYLVGTEYKSLGKWHPTANTAWQKQQEISIGREPGNAMEGNGTINSSHLPIGQVLKGKHSTNKAVDKTVTDTRNSTQKGMAANKEVYMSRHSEWRELATYLLDDLRKASSNWPLVHIEDISYHFRKTADGLPAGLDRFYKDDAYAQGRTAADIASSTMDIHSYVAEATKAYDNGGRWLRDKDDGGDVRTEAEPFDSDNLKEKHRIPHQAEKERLGGSSMLSGALSDTRALAYTSAEAQYENYKAYVNMFHYTGVAVFRDGARYIAEEEVDGTYQKPWEKIGYHASIPSSSDGSASAEQNAWNLLAAETVPGGHPAHGTATAGWTAAQTTLAADNKPLAVSGLKDNDPDNPDTKDNPRAVNVSFEWHSTIGGAGTWAPYEPAALAPRDWPYQIEFEEGGSIPAIARHNLAATEAAFVKFKDASRRAAVGDGCTWPAPSIVSFETSITGRGTSRTVALTEAMEALNTYSSTQYTAYGSGLNDGRLTPVNTVDDDPYNFFHTGITAWADGSSATPPVALFDPYDSSDINLGWTSRILYRALACGCVPAEHVCESDMTASSCPEISASSSIHDLHDNCESADCEVRVLEDGGLDVSTNWVTAVGDVRNSIYDAIRTRLVAQEYNNANNTSCNTHAAAGAVGSYSFSNIGTSLAVYPNFAALCNISDNYADISWQDGNDVDAPPTWSTNGLRTVSQANDAVAGVSVGGNQIYQIINLKDWTAGTGDKDIYVMEEVNMVNGTITDDSTECDGNVIGRNGDAQRDLVRYGYRTAVFSPDDMSDLNGGWDGSSILGTTTTPLTSPVVYVGEGSCPKYNSYVYEATVTGRIDVSKAQAFVPLARNNYEGRIIASGYIPVVTGICDWSANKRQIYYPNGGGAWPEAAEASAGWGNELRKPQMSGVSSVSESYLVNYPKGVSGLLSPRKDAADAAKKAKLMKNVSTSINKPYFDSLKIPNHKLLGLSGINSLITKPHKGTDGYSSVFLGGWPVKNQTNAETSKAFQTKSVFGKKYIILRPKSIDDVKESGKEASSLIKKNESPILRRILLGSKTKIKSDESALVIEHDVGDFQETIAGVQTIPAMANMNKTVVSIKWENGTLSAKIHGDRKERNIELIGKGGKSRWNFVGNEKAEIHNYIVVDFEMQAAACDQCLPSPVGLGDDPDLDVADEVMFYGENYRHMIQVDWELRSGGWNFKVPYVEPGQILERKGREDVTMKNWWEYITNDFMNESSAEGKTPLYTGHHTSWGQPFKGTPTSINCEGKQKSKYDKIFDFHLDFTPKTSNYLTLKKNAEGGSNEIDFEQKK